jgi:hypothetical protein
MRYTGEHLFLLRTTYRLHFSLWHCFAKLYYFKTIVVFVFCAGAVVCLIRVAARFDMSVSYSAIMGSSRIMG